jgi:hypothetical protein
VLETVDGIGRCPATEGQSGRGQLRECFVELDLGDRRDRGDKPVAELASIAAPIWEISFTGMNRSSRAISESRSVAGIVTVRADPPYS